MKIALRSTDTHMPLNPSCPEPHWMWIGSAGPGAVRIFAFIAAIAVPRSTPEETAHAVRAFHERARVASLPVTIESTAETLTVHDCAGRLWRGSVDAGDVAGELAGATVLFVVSAIAIDRAFDGTAAAQALASELRELQGESVRVDLDIALQKIQAAAPTSS